MTSPAQPTSAYRQNYIVIGFFVLLLLPFFLSTALILLLVCLIAWPFRNFLLLLIAGVGVWLLRQAIQISAWLVQKGDQIGYFVRREIEIRHLRRRSNRNRIGQPAP